ncbi:hypothetical protein V493_08635 [Pseudogymnoascus sp. VKM F-4281 (FW-2241)]|nr:hypothetical protein V493_08635 [Pseudogymnoascus sp. VKM F-4281 (FW-2241)]
MASPEGSSSSTVSLLALPGEIQNAILAVLDFPDLHKLRLTNSYFYALIPRVSRERRRIFACIGCERLRPVTEFSLEAVPYGLGLGPFAASRQRCRECVHGTVLEPGSRWEECGVPLVRCLECKMIRLAPVDTRVKLCLLCHPEDLDDDKPQEQKEGSEGTKEQEDRIS